MFFAPVEQQVAPTGRNFQFVGNSMVQLDQQCFKGDRIVHALPKLQGFHHVSAFSPKFLMAKPSTTMPNMVGLRLQQDRKWRQNSMFSFLFFVHHTSEQKSLCYQRCN